MFANIKKSFEKVNKKGKKKSSKKNKKKGAGYKKGSCCVKFVADEPYVFREFDFSFPLADVLCSSNYFNRYYVSFLHNGPDLKKQYTAHVHVFRRAVNSRSRCQARLDRQKFIIWREWGCYDYDQAPSSVSDNQNLFFFSPDGRNGVLHVNSHQSCNHIFTH